MKTMTKVSHNIKIFMVGISSLDLLVADHTEWIIVWFKVLMSVNVEEHASVMRSDTD